MTAARERLNTSDVCVRTPLKACVHQTIDPCMQTPSRRLRAANYLISIAFGLTGRTERAGALHASIDACTGALHASIDACNPKSASACSQLPDFNCFRVDWTHETPRGVACIDQSNPHFSRVFAPAELHTSDFHFYHVFMPKTHHLHGSNFATREK